MVCILISKWVARGLSGGHNSNFGKLRLVVCTVWCRYGSTDMGEISSVGKRWTVPVVQRALCPPICRSLGGQALSEDSRRCSFELPTHPRLRFISTLVVLWILFPSLLVTVGYCCARRPHIPRKSYQDTGLKFDSSSPGIKLGRCKVQRVERSTRTIRNKFVMLSYICRAP